MKWGHATEPNTQRIALFPLSQNSVGTSLCDFLQSLGEFPFGPVPAAELGLPRDSALGILWPFLKRKSDHPLSHTSP